MYGMILIEPEGGLSTVDRELYVMQGELYTVQRHGVQGEHEFSLEKLLDERPEHLTFNGTMDALNKTYKMESKVGETVRIYFGVGGPNATSSFHVIGQIFDRLYILVDHALSRLEKGLSGVLHVTGPEQPDIFHSKEKIDPNSGH